MGICKFKLLISYLGTCDGVGEDGMKMDMYMSEFIVIYDLICILTKIMA